MKKYKMFLFTLLIFIATFFTYIQEYKEFNHKPYKVPTLNFNSKRFGHIRNISPIGNPNFPSFFILWTNDNSKTSTLSTLDINKNTAKDFFTFNTNENLQDVLLVDSINQRIVYPSKEGAFITKVILGLGEHPDEIGLHPSFVEIKDFQNANSAVHGYNLFYSKNNDDLIHSRNLENSFNMSFFMSNQKPKEEVLYYKNPLAVIGVNDLDKIIYYTKASKEGINLLGYSVNRNKNSSDDIVLKNFVHGKPLEFGFGLTGIYEKDNAFNVFIINRFDTTLEIGTIPKNTDALGQVPDVYTISFNDEYYCLYSSFNENHQGSLYFKTHLDSEPKEILKNQPVVGPIKLFQSNINPEKGSLRFDQVLFTTLEEDKIHVKIYNISTDKLQDITEFFK